MIPREGVPALGPDQLVEGLRLPRRLRPGRCGQRKRPPSSPVLNFDRPLFHANSAAIPRVSVPEHAPAPERVRLQRWRGGGRAPGRVWMPFAWTLLGHSVCYRMSHCDRLPSQFRAAISARHDEGWIRSRRLPAARFPFIWPWRRDFRNLAIEPASVVVCTRRRCRFASMPVAAAAASNVSANFPRRLPVNLPLKQAIVTGAAGRATMGAYGKVVCSSGERISLAPIA